MLNKSLVGITGDEVTTRVSLVASMRGHRRNG